MKCLITILVASWILNSSLPFTYEARTWHQRCRTHILRNRMLLPKSCHMVFIFFLTDSRRRSFNSSRFALNRADSGCIGLNLLYQPIQAKIQKKKKKRVWNTLFEPNIKPDFQLISHKHTEQALCLSLTPSHISHSLCALCLYLCLLWNTQPVPSQPLDSLQLIPSLARFLSRILNSSSFQS